MKSSLLSTLFCLIFPIIFAAPSIPNDCKRRLKRMDDSFKIGMIITNPKERLYESEAVFNQEYCL